MNGKNVKFLFVFYLNRVSQMAYFVFISEEFLNIHINVVDTFFNKLVTCLPEFLNAAFVSIAVTN